MKVGISEAVRSTELNLVLKSHAPPPAAPTPPAIAGGDGLQSSFKNITMIHSFDGCAWRDRRRWRARVGRGSGDGSVFGSDSGQSISAWVYAD